MIKTLLCCVVALTIAVSIVVGVNAASPLPTHDPIEERCTRACHDHGCAHFDEQAANPTLVSLYRKNIELLRKNGLGLSYKHANLLLYVLVVPFSFLVLLWGLFREVRR